MRIKIFIASLFVALVGAVYFFYPPLAEDWIGVFRLACIALLRGQSPYGITGYPFANPPWVLFPLLPIALLSPALGSAVLFVANLFAFTFTALRLKMNILLIAPFIFLTTPNSFNGNIEGLVALGFILPPQIGLFFLLAKPQIGIAAAVFFAVEAWREDGIRKVIKIFAPVVIAYLISFLLFGLWIIDTSTITTVAWNTSIWPYGIPIGLSLLMLAIWKRDIRFAVGASPFLSPYLALTTWSFVAFGLCLMFDKRLLYSFVPQKAVTV